MLALIERCFAESFANFGWREKLRTMIPSYGLALGAHSDVLERTRSRSHERLGLTRPVVAVPGLELSRDAQLPLA